MRKCSLIFALALAILLSGCFINNRSEIETVAYYYPRVNILYGAEDGVISAEYRDASLSGPSLEARLADYLSGPQSVELISPFPQSTRLVAVDNTDGTLSVTLGNEFFTLTGLDLTIASASLAQTCFGLTDASQVLILSEDGQNSITLTREDLIFADESDAIQMTIGTESTEE